MKIENITANSDVKCPFCQEGGFDLIGLKQHIINGWCEVFNDITPPKNEKPLFS